MINDFIYEVGTTYFVILLALLVIQLILILLVIFINHKCNFLRRRYNSFMRGSDGTTLEKKFSEKFEEVDYLLEENGRQNSAIQAIRKEISGHYQKTAIVKYDAFLEMGGKLSFALTMLDGNHNGWILNVMHSREGAYTYVKEIVKGESFIELAAEEAESLERAISHEKAQ